jgi:hypothetical protein
MYAVVANHTSPLKNKPKVLFEWATWQTKGKAGISTGRTALVSPSIVDIIQKGTAPDAGEHGENSSNPLRVRAG